MTIRHGLRGLRLANALINIFAAVLLALAGTGCGNGASHRNFGGRVTVGVEWPKPTRLIPDATTTVHITIRSDHGAVLAEQTISRPEQGGKSNAVFRDLPVGPVLIGASAFATGGYPVAEGFAKVTVISGENPTLAMTLESTIVRIQLFVNSTPKIIQAGGAVDVVLTANDGFGRIVITTPARIVWSSSAPGIATVDGNGRVNAISAGQTTITATDTESGVSGTLVITVQDVADAPIKGAALNTNDIVFDPFSNKIYASVPSSAGANGNSVAAIDPVTGAVGPFVFVGSEPGRLAVSDDGKYLYVALNGASAIRRVDLATFTADIQFSVGPANFVGPLTVVDLAVQPRHANVVVATYYRVDYPTPNIVAFDNGTARPTSGGSYLQLSSISFDTSTGLLYGGSNEFITALVVMSVTSGGITVNSQIQNVPNGILAADNGRLFTAGGTVIDASTGAKIGSIGAGLVIPDPTLGRIFVLTGPFDVPAIQTYDRDTLALIATRDLGGFEPIRTDERRGSFIRWGATGLAFRTHDGRVAILSKTPGL